MNPFYLSTVVSSALLIFTLGWNPLSTNSPEASYSANEPSEGIVVGAALLQLPPPVFCIPGTPIVVTICDDNGTPTDETDDFFTFTIEVPNNGSCGSTYTLAESNGQCVDCCPGNGSLSRLLVRYTGEDCSASNTNQTGWGCMGDPGFDPTVYVIANSSPNPNNPNYVWFTGNVNIDETFVLDAANDGEEQFRNRIFMHIYDEEGGTNIQTIVFRSACNQPLGLDDQYGSIQINGAMFNTNQTCGFAGFEDCCETGSKPARITFTYTGEDCSATDNGQNVVSCSGDPMFAPLVYIISNDDTDPFNTDAVWFSGEVALGGSFTADAANVGEPILFPNTHIHIFDEEGGNLLQTIFLKTNCNQPLTVLDQFGSCIITETVMDDGNTCVPPSAPVTGLAYNVVNGPFGPFPYSEGSQWINVVDELDPGSSVMCYEITPPPPCFIVPVEMTSFTGRLVNAEVLLDWTTATEVENDGFEVLRSSDGRVWEKLGFVQGAGNTLQAEAYTFVDSNPSTGINYYQLNQLDFDGTSHLSNVVTVEVKGKTEDLIVQPNPSNGIFDFFLPEGTVIQSGMTGVVYDLRGLRMMEFEVTDSPNGTLDISNLANGIYLVEVRNGAKVFTTRVVKAD